MRTFRIARETVLSWFFRRRKRLIFTIAYSTSSHRARRVHEATVFAEMLMHYFRHFLAVTLLVSTVPATAQEVPPPAVGVTKVERQPIMETSEFIGRIQAVSRVDVVPRVTAFLQERLFFEGGEVSKGDLLYRLERAPFEAGVQAKQAAVKQVEAQLQNANIALDRARELLKSSAGSRASFDTAEANQRSQAAQLLVAQAGLRQSQIELDYAEIRSPIDGTIGRTMVTEGNVVSPESGMLTTIVSQDPMYVMFSVPVRTALELRQKIASEGNLGVVRVKIRLPDGRLYGESGKLDFLSNVVTANTDSLTLRAVMPNPMRSEVEGMTGAKRELIDGELVTVVLEGAEPIEMLTVPRAAILSDQGGDYVYVIDAQERAQRQNVKLGQPTPKLAVVTDGLREGQRVIVEGLQRVRPGQPVSAGPSSASPSDPEATPNQIPEGRG